MESIYYFCKTYIYVISQVLLIIYAIIHCHYRNNDDVEFEFEEESKTMEEPKPIEDMEPIKEEKPMEDSEPEYPLKIILDSKLDITRYEKEKKEQDEEIEEIIQILKTLNKKVGKLCKKIENQA
jgi:hypothetical protein